MTDLAWPIMLELRQVSWGPRRVTIPRPKEQRELVRRQLVAWDGDALTVTDAGEHALTRYAAVCESERRRQLHASVKAYERAKAEQHASRPQSRNPNPEQTENSPCQNNIHETTTP